MNPRCKHNYTEKQILSGIRLQATPMYTGTRASKTKDVCSVDFEVHNPLANKAAKLALPHVRIRTQVNCSCFDERCPSMLRVNTQPDLCDHLQHLLATDFGNGLDLVRPLLQECYSVKLTSVLGTERDLPKCLELRLKLLDW